MNKFYVIVPGALLLVFLGVERDFQKKRAKEDATRAAIATVAKAEEDATRLEKQRVATEEVHRRTAERERLEQERVDRKRRDYETAVATLQQQAAAQEAETAKLTHEIADLAERVTGLRDRKDEVEREAFDLSRAVARQRIDRRNAELEIQRTTAMVAARLSESPWANPALPSPPSPGK
jgi:hypothetical protein